MNHEPGVFDLQAQLCQSLGNATRLQIIHTLKEGSKPVTEIATAVGASGSTVSRHLAILRSTGLLTSRRRGLEIYYEITTPKLVEVCEMMRGILLEREVQNLELVHHIHG